MAEQGKIIETLGTITKKEILTSIEDAFSGGYLVLENLHPFPGYHGRTIPDGHQLIPDSLFFITKEVYSHETVLRASHEIRKRFQQKFDVTPGEITLFNTSNNCLRVKFLKSYSDIKELITAFAELGFQFAKSKNVAPYEGLIKVNKFFELEQLEPGILLDTDDPDMCYLQVPKKLSWEEFEAVTLDIKRNLNDDKFDAAQALIFRKSCVVDYIRIYDHHLKHEKINKIKNKYLEAIKKI